MSSTALRTWRKSLGMTQDQLAGYLDVSRSQVNRWETGKAAVPIMLTLLIAHARRLYRAEHPALTDPEHEEVGAEQGYEGDGQTG